MHVAEQKEKKMSKADEWEMRIENASVKHADATEREREREREREKQ